MVPFGAFNDREDVEGPYSKKIYDTYILFVCFQIKVSNTTKKSQKGIRYIIDITVDRIVLFLWLETSVSGGYFVDNGFIVTRRIFTVYYINEKRIAPQELEKSIHYKCYYNGY